METLLLVDDDLSLLESLKMHFEDARQEDGAAFNVLTATTAAGAIRAAQESQPSLVILDMMLPDKSGLEIIEPLKTVCGDAPILIVTAHHDMETTIRAMKAGAFDYIHKPFPDPAALDLVVSRALSVRRLSRRASAVTVDAPSFRLGDIVGTSPLMQELVKEIGKVAASRATVLISGESGTGKELVARVIHHYSYDEPKPFVGINCSAIVDTLLESELFGHEKGAFTGAVGTKQGKFELAEDGTVFLDEIGDLSPMLQAKLLRVFQQRREDIPALVHHLLARINEKVHKRVTRVPPEVLEHLCRLPWRGNIRELENVLTRAVVLAPGEVLLSENLPPLESEVAGAEAPVAPPHDWLYGGPGGDPPRIPPLDEAERVLISRALAATSGPKGKTGQILR